MTLLPIEQGTFDAHWSPGRHHVRDGRIWRTATAVVGAKGELDTFRLPERLRGIGVSRAQMLLADNGSHILMTSADGIAHIHDRRNGAVRIDLQPRWGWLHAGAGGERRRQAAPWLVRMAASSCTTEAGALAGKDGSVIVKSGPRIVELQLGRHGDLVFAYRTPDRARATRRSRHGPGRGTSWTPGAAAGRCSTSPSIRPGVDSCASAMPTCPRCSTASGKPEPRNVLIRAARERSGKVTSRTTASRS